MRPSDRSTSALSARIGVAWLQARRLASLQRVALAALPVFLLPLWPEAPDLLRWFALLPCASFLLEASVYAGVEARLQLRVRGGTAHGAEAARVHAERRASDLQLALWDGVAVAALAAWTIVVAAPSVALAPLLVPLFALGAGLVLMTRFGVPSSTRPRT